MDWSIHREIIRRSWKILLEIYFYITIPLLALIMMRIVLASIGVLFEFISWVLAGPLLFSLFHVTERFIKGKDFEVKDYFYFLNRAELKKHWPILILPQILMFLIFQITSVLHGSVVLSIVVVLLEAFLSVLLTVLQLKALAANEKSHRQFALSENRQVDTIVKNTLNAEDSRAAFERLKFELPRGKADWQLWCGYALSTLFICTLCLLLFVLPFFFVALPMWIVSNFVFVHYLQTRTLPDIKESFAK